MVSFLSPYCLKVSTKLACHRWTKGNVDDYHLTPEQVNKCIKINHLYRLRSYTISHYCQMYKSVYALMLETTMSHHNQLYTSVYALML